MYHQTEPHYKCSVCGKTDVSEIIAKANKTIRRCTNCNHKSVVSVTTTNATQPEKYYTFTVIDWTKPIEF